MMDLAKSLPATVPPVTLSQSCGAFERLRLGWPVRWFGKNDMRPSAAQLSIRETKPPAQGWREKAAGPVASRARRPG